MSVRFHTDHITTQTNQEIEFEIIDTQFSGSKTKLKGTAEFDDTLQQLDPRSPLDRPVQKRQITFGVWILPENQFFVDDLFSSEEGRFRVKYYKDGVLEWQGNILPDLCSFEEDSPYKLNIVAKDFSALSGLYYTDDSTINGNLLDGRSTVIEKFASILSDVADINIKTRTSWIIDDTNNSDDFLRQAFTDNFALRTYGRTGDESDEPITKIEALEILAANFGCIVKQVEGVWLIDQITAYEDATDVVEFLYDSSGTLISSSLVDTTSTNLITIESTSNPNPGIKGSRFKFDHRTTVSNLQLPSNIFVEPQTDPKVFSQFIAIGTGTTIQLRGNAVTTYPIPQAQDGELRVSIESPNFYWDNEDLEWKSGSGESTFPVVILRDNITGRTIIDIETKVLPESGEYFLSFFLATPGADSTSYQNLEFTITGAAASENSTFIDFELIQDGEFSKNISLNDAFFGDGPVGYSRASISRDVGGNDLTSDDWARRGESVYLPFAHNLLREALDAQRGTRRKINAVCKQPLSFGEIVVYEGDFFYVLGGRFNPYNGVSTVELLQVDIVSAEDTFRDLPKFSADDATGATAPSTGAGGGGLDQGTADNRYFRQINNLSEGDAPTIRDNLDLGSFSLLDELPKLTADGGVAFTTGSEEIWDVSSEVWDQSNQVWFNEDSFYNGTQETTLTALFDDQTIGLTNGDLEVKDDGISTAKIQDDAIVEAKLADDSISTGKIQNGAVIESKVDDDAISTAKIQDSAVTNAKLENSTISGKQLGTNLDSLSAGNGLVGNPYNGSSGETHALGTPSTITIGGSNNVTSDSHEHALDLSGRTLTGGTGVDAIGDLGQDRTISTVPATPTQEGHVSTVAQSFAGDKTFEDKVKLKDLIEADFDPVTDFTGVGWQATDAGDFNIRNLVVREAARFRELIIDQLSAVGGSFLYSAARGKVESRDGNVIKLEDPNDKGATQFAVDDIFVVRVVDIDGAEVKFITGRVSAVDGVEITLAQDIADTSGSITSISPGDVIVQRGNTTDTTRQNAIYVTATDSDAPSQKYFTGLDSIDAFNQEANIVVQSGNLENITEAEGFGFFGENTFLTGSLLVGDLSQSQSGKFLKFDGTDLTGRFSNIEFESEEFKLESNDLLLQSGTDAKLQVGEMTFGLNVDTGVNGIKIDSDNFWYDNSQFNVGGEDGIRFFPSQVWDDSAEVWDQSAAFWDAPIRIGSDTVFEGNLEAVGGTFTGTLQGVDGSFTGTLDAVTGSFDDVEISPGGKLDGSSWSLDRTRFNLGQARITNANESFFIRGTANGMSIITEDEGVQNVILDVLEDRIQVRGIRGESLSAQAPTDMRFRLPDGDPLENQKWYTKEFGDLTSSDVVVCVSQATVVPPSQPSNVATCDNSAAFGFGSIKIQWDAVQNADTYRIQRSTSETTGFTDLTVITGTEHTDVIFEGGFWYRVRAENAAGNSAYTSAVFGEVGVTPPC